jgi:hypothetical protein
LIFGLFSVPAPPQLRLQRGFLLGTAKPGPTTCSASHDKACPPCRGQVGTACLPCAGTVDVICSPAEHINNYAVLSCAGYCRFRRFGHHFSGFRFGTSLATMCPPVERHFEPEFQAEFEERLNGIADLGESRQDDPRRVAPHLGRNLSFPKMHTH